MDTQRPEIPDPQTPDSNDGQRDADVREAVTSADVTGLIAGEELITQAETILPTAPEDTD